MKKNNVLIALKMSGIAGQSKLAGIFRYLNEKYGDKSPWDIHLLRSRNDLTQETVRDAVEKRTDGFIISIPDMENSVLPLSDISTPTIISPSKTNTPNIFLIKRPQINKTYNHFFLCAKFISTNTNYILSCFFNLFNRYFRIIAKFVNILFPKTNIATKYKSKFNFSPIKVNNTANNAFPKNPDTKTALSNLFSAKPAKPPKTESKQANTAIAKYLE